MVYNIEKNKLSTIPSNCEIVKFPIDYGFIDLIELYNFNSLKMCGIVRGNTVFMTKKNTFIIVYNKINKGEISIEEIFNKTLSELIKPEIITEKIPHYELTTEYIRMDLFDNCKYVSIAGNTISSKKFVDIISGFELYDCKTLKDCLMVYFKLQNNKE
jgi:hypothetical protein